MSGDTFYTDYGRLLECWQERRMEEAVGLFASLLEGFMWAERHDESVFSFFVEKCVLGHLPRALRASLAQPTRTTRLLNALYLVIVNVNSAVFAESLASWQAIDQALQLPFSAECEDVLLSLVNVVKAIAMRWPQIPAAAFCRPPHFPLLARAVSLAAHRDPLTRTSAFAAVLMFLSEPSRPHAAQAAVHPPLSSFFSRICTEYCSCGQGNAEELLAATVNDLLCVPHPSFHAFLRSQLLSAASGRGALSLMRRISKGAPPLVELFVADRPFMSSLLRCDNLDVALHALTDALQAVERVSAVEGLEEAITAPSPPSQLALLARLVSHKCPAAVPRMQQALRRRLLQLIEQFQNTPLRGDLAVLAVELEQSFADPRRPLTSLLSLAEQFFFASDPPFSALYAEFYAQFPALSLPLDQACSLPVDELRPVELRLRENGVFVRCSCLLLCGPGVLALFRLTPQGLVPLVTAKLKCFTVQRRREGEILLLFSGTRSCLILQAGSSAHDVFEELSRWRSKVCLDELMLVASRLRSLSDKLLSLDL